MSLGRFCYYLYGSEIIRVIQHGITLYYGCAENLPKNLNDYCIFKVDTVQRGKFWKRPANIYIFCR